MECRGPRGNKGGEWAGARRSGCSQPPGCSVGRVSGPVQVTGERWRPVGDGQQGQRPRREERVPGSQAGTDGDRGACRGQLQRAQNQWGAAAHRVAQGWTADVAGGRWTVQNVGAEMAAEARGGVAATGGARTSDRARRRQTGGCKYRGGGGGAAVLAGQAYRARCKSGFLAGSRVPT